MMGVAGQSVTTEQADRELTQSPDIAYARDGSGVLVFPNTQTERDRRYDPGTGVLHPEKNRRLSRLKRAMDLLIAVPAGVVSLPLICLMIVAVKLVDPGPAIFTQRRVGLNGRPMDMFKIRSMYVGAERMLEEHLRKNAEARIEWRRHCKLRNDVRILPGFGHFIRRMSLDELPQIWNVIRGDMSLVGPRPFPSYHVELFDERFQRVRSSIPPGITGLWQVMARSDADLEKQRKYDLYYIRNRSILLDIYILLRTVPAVLGGKGAH